MLPIFAHIGGRKPFRRQSSFIKRPREELPSCDRKSPTRPLRRSHADRTRRRRSPHNRRPLRGRQLDRVLQPRRARPMGRQPPDVACHPHRHHAMPQLHARGRALLLPRRSASASGRGPRGARACSTSRPRRRPAAASCGARARRRRRRARHGARAALHARDGARGAWAPPCDVDVLTSAAANVRTALQRAGRLARGAQVPLPAAEAEEVRAVMRERMARILFFLHREGVEGSSGTGAFGNDVAVVARIWAGAPWGARRAFPGRLSARVVCDYRPGDVWGLQGRV
ncbi:hypothetical protein B0H10DRAFT_2199470 [Mycena sp. CBHHK59/15]|nr:hypothetical protein B0H10DRAFT_2199470 [Mycena sp. CBHHK59/15]